MSLRRASCRLGGSRRPTALLVVGAALASTFVAVRQARAWDPLRSAGRSVAAGAVESIKPALASTIEDTFAAGHRLVADVDTRLATRVSDLDRRVGGQVDHLGGVATGVVARADQGLANRISQIDDALDKRITQLAAAEHGVVRDIDTRLKQDLERADAILRDRTRDIGQTLRGALTQADEILAQRIEQLDEAVGRRLGNVDVIATKQRLAIEQTLIRVAVLMGLVVLVVFVLVSLWRRWASLADQSETESRAQYRWRLARALGGSLALQVGGAVVAAGVLLVLYQRLPLGAAANAEDLVDRHKRELEESLALFEFARVKFHASQLELLLPEESRHYRAQAAKAELMRDVLSRPALLASASGIASVVDRVHAAERLLGDEADADLLVVKAFVLWQVGRLARDEHEAASLCARAFRVRPAGFALAPLGRSIIEDFLAAPYVPGRAAFGRDSETLASLRAVLTRTAPDRPGFPLAPAMELAAATRRVRATTGEAYVRMIEAHAEVVRLGGGQAGKQAGGQAAARGGADKPDALAAARDRRAREAGAIVAAWESFDREIAEIPGLAGGTAVLAVFQLNDVTYTRARWFTLNPAPDSLAPALTAVAPAQRALLRPPRVAWATRYAQALGSMRDVFDFQEAERWKALEAEVIAFEKSLVAASTLTGPAADAQRREAALRSARLGLFVVRPDRGGSVPYAEILLGEPAKRDSAIEERKAIDEALAERPLRFASAPPGASASANTNGNAPPTPSPPNKPRGQGV